MKQESLSSSSSSSTNGMVAATSQHLSPKNNTACIDPLDFNQYIDLDQTVYPSPANTTTSQLSRGKAAIVVDGPQFKKPSFSNTNNNNVAFLPHQPQSSKHQLQQQPTYAGPSHQYDSYPQQTGLPLGAFASTFALPSQSSTDYSSFGASQDFDLTPSDGFYDGGMSTIDENFDFNSFSGHNPSFSTTADLDMEFSSPPHDFFVPSPNTQATDFVDPNIIGGQEGDSAASTPVQATVGTRIYPGMHQQRALQAQQQKQQQMTQQRAAQRSQQHTAPPHTQMPMQHPQQQQQQQQQQPLPQPKKPAGSNRPPTDPIVEERISRLLNQMRQNCESSANDPDSPSGSNHPHMPRSRKDEEDMDEDERLLASEEGKKLSSKERRQLRNKVSARAFRSRRKEYIGQLEGEIATKVKEAEDLRVRNDALESENTRLTDLTRMLLSSPAFSTFLNDLSSNGGTLPASATKSTLAPAPQSQQQQPLPTPTRKDANPHQSQYLQQQQQQQQLHSSSNTNNNGLEHDFQVGMTLVPEPSSSMDFNVFDPTALSSTNASNNWAMGGSNMLGFNGSYNARVFSVFDVPQGPTVDQEGIDAGVLSGKVQDLSAGLRKGAEKESVPRFERMPAEKQEGVVEREESSSDINDEAPSAAALVVNDVEFDESDPCFALFIDDAPVSTASSTNYSEVDNQESRYQIFGSIELEKALQRIDMIIPNDEAVTSSSAESGRTEEISTAAIASFEQLCARMDDLSRGIDGLMG
ncbi:hypothetical protein MMC25_002140 [Agyrium rufum]|nr:hypothetical protein [Agyrium rufum]